MQRQKAVLAGLLFLLFQFVTCTSFAATINVRSCLQPDVQAAIDTSTSGDDVVVPQGECSWSSSIKIPKTKKITLRGSGTATIITYGGTDGAINLLDSGSRLTGFKIIFPAGSTGYGVYVYGYGWRIDHCEFDNQTASSKMGVYVRGSSSYPDPTGLVDNCTFLNCRVNVQGNAVLFAHTSWNSDYQLGSADFVFVEDCKFDRSKVFGNSIDCQYGGNYVFRHNTVVNSYIEAHSALGDEGHRAARLWEVYDNVIFTDQPTSYAPFRLRGGTGVVYNNTVTGSWGDPNILLDNDRSISPAKCDGSKVIDGNEDGGWPCRDQVGRGRDLTLWTSESPYPKQASDPAYAWNNTKSGTGAAVKFKVIAGCEKVLVEARDFFNLQKSDYTPYTYPHPFRQAETKPLPPAGIRLIEN